jgi:hypothetical protein
MNFKNVNIIQILIKLTNKFLKSVFKIDKIIIIMGNCNCNDIIGKIDIEDTTPAQCEHEQSKKEVILTSIKSNLLEIEEYLRTVQKEDVYYKNIKLPLLLNAINDLTPYIKHLENAPDNIETFNLKEYFDNVFSSIWKYDKESYQSNLEQIKNFFDYNYEIYHQHTSIAQENGAQQI